MHFHSLFPSFNETSRVGEPRPCVIVHPTASEMLQIGPLLQALRMTTKWWSDQARAAPSIGGVIGYSDLTLQYF